MSCFTTLFFFVTCLYTNAHYSLYHSNQRRTSYPIFDCVYAHLVDEGRETGSRYIRDQYLIPYCRRPDPTDNDDENEQYPQFGKHILRSLLFDELKNNDTTSDQLLLWNSPVDTAEQYAMNVNNFHTFYLCSSPWFGTQCQYRFDIMSNLSFTDVVKATFEDYSHHTRNSTQGSCYRFVEGCDEHRLWPDCLDWRQICDGKLDCRHGEDERWCEQLDMTQCNANEYRCHFGSQCIPKSFLKDSRLSVDCLDGSDENDYLMMYSLITNSDCSDISTFRCQERKARYHLGFNCGDGSSKMNHLMPNRLVVCLNNRDREISRSILTKLDQTTSNECRQAFYCGFFINRTNEQDQSLLVDNLPLNPIFTQTSSEECEPLSKYCSSEWLVIPDRPIMFDYFQLIYFTNRSVQAFKERMTPDIVCFNPAYCPRLAARGQSIDILSNLTCLHLSTIIEVEESEDLNDFFFKFLSLNRECSLMGIEQSCDNDSYFYCEESMKCISKTRVGDGAIDCSFSEDESFDTCSWNDTERFQCTSDPQICLLPVALGNGYADCPKREDETFSYTDDLVKLVPYPMICDNELTINSISETNDADDDESNCHLWPCNNPYTRCSFNWDCPTGFDELNCSASTCSSDEFECLNEESNEIHCIPFDNIHEKRIHHCRNQSWIQRTFYFINDTTALTDEYLSWTKNKCLDLNDICLDGYDVNASAVENGICLQQSYDIYLIGSAYLKTPNDDKDFCAFHGSLNLYSPRKHLLVSQQFGFYPSISSNVSLPSPTKIKATPLPQINRHLRLACNRGIAVMTSINQTIKCLCPPNFYGSKCQWQSQRISLTIQFLWRNTLSDVTIFQVVIMLIDQYGNIAPYHEQLTYMPKRDCNTKFHFYLLYPHRPKRISTEYFIRIDLFEKTKLIYWTSWFLPIPFAFLPVNRIATQLIIPAMENNDPCPLDCGHHGHCRSYRNDPNKFFCQCEQGYSGIRCTKTHHCFCAKDSLCLSPSICVCPLYKFGSYCYLNQSICQSTSNPCQHNSLCIPTDDRIDRFAFTCVCSENFSGERCENRNNQISIDFGSTIIQSHSLILLHFVTILKDAEHERTTILKKTLVDQQSLTVRFARPFHLLFLQIPSQSYHLLIIREQYIPSESIRITIQDEQRCPSIDHLVEPEIAQQSYLRRTKFYPSICRQHRTLMCFYDHHLMCICDLDRFANCFFFNHTMNIDCQGYNPCENDGHCYQDNEICPTKSTCICADCYYGARCQFSTKGILFSLDPILGYHIRPHVSLDRQSSIVQTSIVIVTLMLICSLVNTILSLMTFSQKKLREVGSGTYLFLSSITSLLMIIALNVKFWYLLFSQMFFIENRSLLLFTCITNDFVLKILLASTEWLNSCVSIERMVSVTKGTNFKRHKSKSAAKWVILTLTIFICLTHLHDPIARRLIDDRDADEERIWCLVRYSSSLRIYNTFVTFLHFLIPFSINVISALYIIKRLAHHRSSVQPDRNFNEHFQHQIQRHQNLIFAPCALTIVCLPRLVMSLSRACIRSTQEPWFYLIGYFVSFIPSILTFIVFVLPSKHYRTEFTRTFHWTLRRLRRSY